MARDKLSDADTDASTTAETPEPDNETAGPDEETPEPDKKAGAGKKAAKKAATRTAAKKTVAKKAAKTAKKAPAKKAATKPAAKAVADTTEQTAEPVAEQATEQATATEPGAGPAGKAAGKSSAQKSDEAKASATSRRATEARAAKQRQHRRIEFVRALAIGVEVAGAAGMVLASLLPWEWDERLLGRTDNPWLWTQVAIGVAVLALALGWIRPRNDGLGTWTRALAIPAAAAVAVLSVATVWQADLGARRAGGIVAVAAAVLAIAGSVGWLVGLQRLRRLFAFGMVYARDHGYGNLAAVRRAQLIGAPVGVLGAAAVVAGTLLVAPGLVTTVDAGTAGPLALEGATPSGGDAPSWTEDVDVDIDRAESAATVYPTPGGLLVDEIEGVRLVDPRDSSQRWHWRDEAYHRVGTVLASAGGTAVLAVRYDGDEQGRDRVVAIDTATGEVRWDRFDPELVEAIATMPEGSTDGDWFAVPDRVEAAEADPENPTADPAAAGATSHGVRVIGADDGETRWRDAGTDGCTVSRLDATAADTVVTTQECPPEQGNPSGCQISARDAAGGSPRWTWPSGDRVDPATQYATSCRVTVLGSVALLTYQVAPFETPEDPEQQPEPTRTPALALDLQTGEESWVIEPEEDSYSTSGVDGVSTPELIGDTIIGPEYPSGQAGNGPATLVMRSVADGSKTGEVELPEGQPIEFAATGDDTVVMTYYQQAEPPQVLLVEVDLAAGEVTSESVVFSSTPALQIGSAGLAAGPETLVVDTLLGSGPEDVRLRLHGYR